MDRQTFIERQIFSKTNDNSGEEWGGEMIICSPKFGKTLEKIGTCVFIYVKCLENQLFYSTHTPIASEIDKKKIYIYTYLRNENLDVRKSDVYYEVRGLGSTPNIAWIALER